MNTIIWSNDYLIGDAEIDQQHQNIVKLINQLIEEINISVNSEKFQVLVLELVEYANGHLAYEEELLRKIEYPDYDNHKSFHEDYVAQFTDYALETMTYENDTPERMLNYLVEWWKNHILIEDMKYKPFL